MLSILGLIGVVACLWVLWDIISALTLDCLMATHLVRRRILTTSWCESHTRMISKFSSMDITMEEFSESVVETVEPFVN